MLLVSLQYTGPYFIWDGLNSYLIFSTLSSTSSKQKFTNESSNSADLNPLDFLLWRIVKKHNRTREK